MSNIPMFWKDNLSPSISDTVTTNGVPVNLTGATVRFRMRPVGGTAYTVDQLVSNAVDATGFVRYDWRAGDTSVPGFYLAWWEVLEGVKPQDVSESLIEIREHAPVSPSYIELEELKAARELTGYSFADGDIPRAIGAASRAIDKLCRRRFWLDADATFVRYYTPSHPSVLRVDDLVTLTKVEADNTGDGVFDAEWAAADYVLEPANAPADGEPWTRIVTRWGGQWTFPCYAQSVRVTGRFGWPAVPPAVQQAALILSVRYLTRAREAPFGVLVALGGEGGLMRISRTDPDVAELLRPYILRTPGI